ncbi:hypothetical protein F2Q68_00045051 [Brassica cretica]|uniref:Transmembrane protein n=1 Tax=Brassica cretica TaxID=69181 RepID=A0A8S9LJW1_BRACR|nr:hypothetical protein F2Q68_00045051 [Brassica cretica]
MRDLSGWGLSLSKTLETRSVCSGGRRRPLGGRRRPPSVFFLSLSPSCISVLFVFVLAAEVGLNLGVLRSRSGGLGSRSGVISAVSMEFRTASLLAEFGPSHAPDLWLVVFFLVLVVCPSSSAVRELLGKSPMGSWLRGCVRFGVRLVALRVAFLFLPCVYVVYTVSGMVGWRRHSSATCPERRHRTIASRFEGAFLSVARGNRLLVPLTPILQVLRCFVSVQFFALRDLYDVAKRKLEECIQKVETWDEFKEALRLKKLVLAMKQELRLDVLL